MTIDLLNAAIRNWIIDNANGTGKLAQLPILTNGEDGPLDAPFVGIMETSSETVIEADFVMHGVYEVALSVVLSTIPASEEDEGTSVEDHREISSELSEILGDRSIMDTTHDGISLFDFRAINATTEASDGRRVTTFQITAVACRNKTPNAF